jgi:hypothetical protein
MGMRVAVVVMRQRLVAPPESTILQPLAKGCQPGFNGLMRC